MRAAHKVILLGRALVVWGALSLCGCASTRLIDTEVTSFSSPELAPPTATLATPDPATSTTTYRFDRLPLRANATEQDLLEGTVIQQLGTAGWILSEQSPAYAVQMDSQVVQYQNINPGPLMGFYRGSNDPNHGILTLRPLMEPPWFRYTVHVVIRQTSNSRVVFESTGIHESQWLDKTHVVPAVLSSALRGFPRIPTGHRKITTELPTYPDTSTP